MAKVILPPFIRSLSGRIGDTVYRTRGDRVFASFRPRRSPRPPTAAQLEVQSRFSLGHVYARSALANPRTAAFYAALARPKQSANAVAFRDYLRPPEISAIALGLYDGLAGDEIIISATDDTEVAAVEVAIKDMTGRVLEQGAAHNRIDGTWVYTATRNAPAGQPLTIEVTASDRPGNRTTRSAPALTCSTS